MRTAAVIVSGIDTIAMDTVLMGLLWEGHNTVALRHFINPNEQTLTRVVSDVTGVIEREVFELEHACVACALREDILPTLLRLADTGRWSAIVVGLPLSAEAEHLARVISHDPGVARRIRLTSVIAALEATDRYADLLGEELLRERGVHTGPHDDRGVGETLCSLVEYADFIVATGSVSEADGALLTALARPEAMYMKGAESIDIEKVLSGRHLHSQAAAWRQPLRAGKLPPVPNSLAWRLDMQSDLPFHPDRLLDNVESLGGGAFRSRGCFWLPTRPDDVNVWEGAGGQLSFGSYSQWGKVKPITRIIFTGVGEPPPHLWSSFEALLVTKEELRHGAHKWSTAEDGLEPWLGEIRRAA